MGYEREHEHAPGTPAWVDLASPDLVVSARFYGGLFGWDTATRGPADVTGGYLTFQVDGRDVAGLAPMTSAAVATGEPPAWTLHIAVGDADEVEGMVVSSAGASLLAPTDVSDDGRTAMFSDPTGAVFGVWQAGNHVGVELVGVPGAMYWCQLASRNIEAAKRFYGRVFGWEGFTTPYETSTYTRFRLGGREVAGMIEMDRSWPRGLPSHWMPYFAVDSCDQTASLAAELGGDVAVEPFDMPNIGRSAVLGDPHGAVFTVLTPDAGFVGLQLYNAPVSHATVEPNGSAASTTGSAASTTDELAKRPSR